MIEAGVCPRCRSTNLQYDTVSDADKFSVSYRVLCSECAFTGYEVYIVEFSHFTTLNGDRVEEKNGKD